MKLDIEEIRQSPTAFVDLETVILLSDRVMILEMKRDELAAQNAVMREALEKLACLGNGNAHGNSIGNDIAIAALTQPNLASEILRKHDAQVLRGCVEEYYALFIDDSVTQQGEWMLVKAAELEGGGK